MDSDETFQTPFDVPSQDSSADQYEDIDLAAQNEGESIAGDGGANADAVDERDPVDQTDAVDERDAAEISAARHAFDSNEIDDGSQIDDESQMDDESAVAVAVPFVESWNTLVSTTNWEKGRIISSWRAALVDCDADPVVYSDAAWVRRVGGVTAPHVGRLRRVYERFGNEFESYDGLYWTHFLAALDWDDAPMWLEGAVQEKWSISKMRDARWRAMGAVDSKRPTASEIIDVDLDEDVVVPSGSGASEDEKGKRDFDGDGPGSTGPQYDEADFGDADELVSLAGSEAADSPAGVVAGGEAAVVQPFRDLPELPDDLSDAIETLKLSILRHKTGGWKDVDASTLDQYLKAIAMLLV